MAQLQAALDGAELPGDAAVTFWPEPWRRPPPPAVDGEGVHVVDLHEAVAACPGAGAGAQAAWCARVAEMCRHASLALVGSAAAQGFWSALLGQCGAGCHVAVVPYGVAAKARIRGRAVAVAGPWIADPALRGMLDSARAWAQAEGVELVAVGTGDGGGSGDAALAARVLLPGAGPAGMLLDLRQDTPAERVASPVAVIEALAAGLPVLTTVDGPLGQAIAAEGAGRVLRDAFLPPPADASAAALAMGDLFTPGRAVVALRSALVRAMERDAAARAAWLPGRTPPAPLGPQGRVLVLSDEAQTVEAVRVHLPLRALMRRGALGGYAVVTRGAVAFDTHPGTARGFDAIWVFRNADPLVLSALGLLGRPFAYDIDDNLLATPAYRDRFLPIAVRTTEQALRRARVVSCGTARLAGLLVQRLDGGPGRAGGLAGRVVVTPNLGEGEPVARKAGVPRAVIWASSDRPALMASTGAIVRAIRDHCLVHRTPVVCIGAVAPEGLRAAGIELEQLGVLPHDEYRARLRALSPAILACPLETDADAGTQAFIDGKSDVKLIEALSDGLVVVGSRAAPFLDSGLPGAILAANEHGAWLDALEQAREACQAPCPAPSWPAGRDASSRGLAPWAAALRQVRLEAPLPMALAIRVLSAVREVGLEPIPEDEFDEADYLENYDDVRDAVADGRLASAYAHYAGPGLAEGRFGRRRASPRTSGLEWWEGLTLELGRLEDDCAAREAALASFERRLVLRRAVAERG